MQFNIITLAVLLLLPVSAGSASAECYNFVRADGGRNRIASEKMTVSLVEFTDEIIRVETDTWMKRHGAALSWKFGDITARENCAGYVLRTRFNLGGPYITNVSPLYEIAKKFGSPMDNLSAKKGDIVFYGPLNHVALVVADAESSYDGEQRRQVLTYRRLLRVRITKALI